MAGKTAILSVRIVSDSDRGVLGINRTARAVSDLERSSTRSGAALRSIAAATPRLALMAATFITLGAAALTSAGHVAGFLAALAPLAGLALALPGVLAGTAIGVGVLAVALKDTSKVLEDLGPKFTRLQSSISGAFWRQAEAPIRSLANAALPLLRTELTRTGTILGSLFARAAQTARAALGSTLPVILSDVNKGLTALGPAVAPAIRGLLTLVQAGTAFLPRLSAAVSNVAARFGAWVNAAAADGRLSGWINDGITALKALGSVVSNVVGVILGIGRAMASVSGGSLGTIAASLGKVNDAINGPVGQGALMKVFGSASTLMAGIAPGIAAIGSALVALGPVVQTIAQQLGPTLGTALTAVGKAVTALAPSAQQLAAALGPALSAAVGALASVLPPIAAALGPIVAQLGTGLATVVTALAPKLREVGQSFTKMLTAVQPLLAVVLPVLVPALKMLGSILLGAVKGAIDGVTLVIQGMTQTLTGLAEFVRGVLTGNWSMAWNGIKNVVTGIVTGIAGALWTWLNVTVVGIFRNGALALLGLWRGGWTALKAAGEAIFTGIKAYYSAWFTGLRTIFTTALNAVRTIFATQMRAVSSTALAIFNTLRTIVSSGLTAVRSLFSTGFTAVRTLVTTAWTAVRTASSNGIGGLVSLVAGLPGRIIGALSGLAGRMSQMGRDMIAGLISGIGNMAGALVEKAKGVVSGAVNAAKSLLGIRSPSRVFKRLGMYTGEGMVIGLASMTRRVQSAMTGMVEPPSARSIMTPTISARRSAGRQSVGPSVVINVNGAMDRVGTAREIRALLRDLAVIEGGSAW